MNTTQFINLHQTAKARIADYIRKKDDASLCAAAFAFGRVSGYYMGQGCPNDWKGEVDILIEKAAAAGVIL